MYIAATIPYVLDKIEFQSTAYVRILDQIHVIRVTATNVTHTSDHAHSFGKIRNRRGRVLFIRYMLHGQEISHPINILALPDDHVVAESGCVIIQSLVL
jgi:hypothetical protein